MAGILPFGAMFIELFFIFTAIWQNQFYYMFGFLFLVFLILVISVSQIAVVMVYFQLCSEVSQKSLEYCVTLFAFKLGSKDSITKIYFLYFCHQDYQWWWRIMYSSGGSALYMLFYAVFYFHTRLEITEFIPTLLYFSYTGLMVLTFWLLTATIGFYAAYMFLNKIYAAVKID